VNTEGSSQQLTWEASGSLTQNVTLTAEQANNASITQEKERGTTMDLGTTQRTANETVA